MFAIYYVNYHWSFNFYSVLNTCFKRLQHVLHVYVTVHFVLQVHVSNNGWVGKNDPACYWCTQVCAAWNT